MKVRRVAKSLAAIAGALVFGALVVGAWYVRAVLPQIDGTAVVAGVGAPVDIVRDSHGVPHIFAATEQDALFAEGFAHAQDRLWQMEMQRRLASGRLSEVLGTATLDIDVMLRTVGIRRTAESIWSRFTPAERAPFEAYARGINAYLRERRGPLPPEFLILAAPTPEPWSPIDSVGWTLMMAWDLGGSWNTKLARLQLLQSGLAQGKIDQLLPAYPGEKYPPIADLRTVYGGLFKSIRAETETARQRLAAFPHEVAGIGSNNWVVGGGRTRSGKPLLANDPHLGLGAPSLWYFVHLASSDGLDAIGASLPGVPGIVLGRNRRIAWGFTNTGPDVQDLFIEKADPDDLRRYKTPDGWQQFDVVGERIKVRGAADRLLDVRSSRHGPIISDGGHPGVTALASAGHAIAFAWTALAAENRTALAGLKFMRAGNWDEFVATARDFDAPEQNMVYADVDGNIGFIAPGRVPIRKPENDIKGLYPVPGWDARYDWAGFIPFDQLPKAYNPATGYLASANQKIVGADYPYAITYNWEAPFRYDRIVSLIEATPKHALASFAAMQSDVVSPAFQQALPHLLAAPTAGPKELALRDLLARWDGAMDRARIEPLIMASWMREFVRTILEANLAPGMARRFFDQRLQFVLDVLADREGASEWCKPKPGGNTHPCDAMIEAALTRALADLERRYGTDQKTWAWGRAHEARSEHRPFGRIPRLARYFDIRVPVGGATATIDVGHYRVADEQEPFTSTHGPSLRALYDFSDLEQSRFIQSTGQSGIVFSRHYADFTTIWSQVGYIPMRTVRAAIETDAEGTLHIVPKAAP